MKTNTAKFLPSGGWRTLSRGINFPFSAGIVSRIVAGDDTSAVLDVEVEWFLRLPLLLNLRVPHFRLPAVGRRECATVAQAMRNKRERRHGQRHSHFITRCSEWRQFLPGTASTSPSQDRSNAAPKPAPSPAARMQHPEKLGVRFGGVKGWATAKRDYFLAALAAIRARKFFSC